MRPDHAERMQRLNAAAVLMKFTDCGVMEAQRLAATLTNSEFAELSAIGQAAIKRPNAVARVQEIRLAARSRIDI